MANAAPVETRTSLPGRDNFPYLNPSMCPALDGKAMQSKTLSGTLTFPFVISCGIDHPRADLLATPVAIVHKGINACIKLCVERYAERGDCFALSFTEGPVGSGNGDCYLKGRVTPDMAIENAHIIAAVRSDEGTPVDGWFDKDNKTKLYLPENNASVHESPEPLNSSGRVSTATSTTTNFYPTSFSSTSIYGTAKNEAPGTGTPVPATKTLPTTAGTGLPPAVDSLGVMLSNKVETSTSSELSSIVQNASSVATPSSKEALSFRITKTTTRTAYFYPTELTSSSIYGAATYEAPGTGTPVPPTRTLPSTAGTGVAPPVNSLGVLIETVQVSSSKVAALPMRLEPLLVLVDPSSPMQSSSSLATPVEHSPNSSVLSSSERINTASTTKMIATPSMLNPKASSITMIPFALSLSTASLLMNHLIEYNTQLLNSTSSTELISSSAHQIHPIPSTGKPLSSSPAYSRIANTTAKTNRTTASLTSLPTPSGPSSVRIFFHPYVNPTTIRPAVIHLNTLDENSTTQHNSPQWYPVGSKLFLNHGKMLSRPLYTNATQSISHSSPALSATLPTGDKVANKTATTTESYKTNFQATETGARIWTVTKGPSPSKTPVWENLPWKTPSWSNSSEAVLRHAHKTSGSIHTNTHISVLSSSASPPIPTRVLTATAAHAITVTESFFGRLDSTQTVYVPSVTMLTTMISFEQPSETEKLYAPMEVTAKAHDHASSPVTTEQEFGAPLAQGPHNSAPMSIPLRALNPDAAFASPHLLQVENEETTPPSSITIGKPHAAFLAVPFSATAAEALASLATTDLAPEVSSATRTTTFEEIIPSSVDSDPQFELSRPKTVIWADWVPSPTAVDPIADAFLTDGPEHNWAFNVKKPVAPTTGKWHTASRFSPVTRATTPIFTTTSDSALPVGIVSSSTTSYGFSHPLETGIHHKHSAGVVVKRSTWTFLVIAIAMGLSSVL